VGMLRITGGELGGRQVRVPDGPVRPTQDRVREALFSMLGDKIVGGRFLDLFAGSGTVGIEALSRGASYVCFVENNKRVYSIMRQSVESLCAKPDNGLIASRNALTTPPEESRRELLAPTDKLRRTETILCDAGTFLEKRVAPEPFHIIFADPPYLRSVPKGRRHLERRTGKAPDDGEREHWLPRILLALSVGQWLVADGLLIMEEPAASVAVMTPGWELLRDRTYGDSRLLVYRRIGGAAAGGAE
jgi:16S rRNA (guanine966-N2)-methyltransferase